MSLHTFQIFRYDFFFNFDLQSLTLLLNEKISVMSYHYYIYLHLYDNLDFRMISRKLTSEFLKLEEFAEFFTSFVSRMKSQPNVTHFGRSLAALSLYGSSTLKLKRKTSFLKQNGLITLSVTQIKSLNHIFDRSLAYFSQIYD